MPHGAWSPSRPVAAALHAGRAEDIRMRMSGLSSPSAFSLSLPSSQPQPRTCQTRKIRGMKRYEGSELIGYRAPKFDGICCPWDRQRRGDSPTYEKSKPIEGQVSYYTYLALWAVRSPSSTATTSRVSAPGCADTV